jgi:hypothetical protein
MGAVWLRANTPSGPTLRARARKLSVVMSFIVAIAMLHSTFLILIKYTELCRRFLLLHARQAYHDSGALVKRGRSDFRRMFPENRDCSARRGKPRKHLRQCSRTLGYSLAKRSGGAL